ncbi:MAG: hypothetical protein EOP51_11670 [Sphingobacteriales bacterium]|nr:MAG: hypothetical protein EOP51_11670 [Sphingobacteriales bacterium]
MQEEVFRLLLSKATAEAKAFASRYIKNQLRENNAYRIQLNISEDDPALTQFELYPEDKGTVIEWVDSDTVLSTLLRKGKVPVWIDIAVLEIDRNTTLLSLMCAGRYSGEESQFYYRDSERAPFGVKSPNLPIDYKEGVQFAIPEKRGSLLKRLFRIT